MNNRENRTVLVTGGAKGIGLAIANQCSHDGYKVWVVDNDEVALVMKPRSVIKMTHLDISKQRDVQQVISSIKPDILINNAAITDGDDFEKIMAVNCNGTRYVTEAALPYMMERGYGQVIFITSIHTALAFQGDAAYDASKHWAIGYMKARAIELAQYGIRVNAVAPGAIYGAGSNAHVEVEAFDSVASKIPAKRWGTPEEIAHAVAFLMSDDSSYIVGHELRVDGGLSIKNSIRD